MGLKKVLAGVYRRGILALPTSVSQHAPAIISDPSRCTTSEEVLVANGSDEALNSKEKCVNALEKSGKSDLRITSIIGLLLIALTAFSTLSGSFDGADSPQCRSIYMYPSYARIDGLDSRFTSLAQKYHLYLYREQGKDRKPLEDDGIQLDGIPVLFIPGNAGSFKQVRSIAAACSNIFFDETEEIQNAHTKNLDFFAADFNEDFTAFHGRTMVDQAEYLNDAIRYILSLYERAEGYNDPLPTSVIIIGHSMGGVVARLLPTLQNHVEHSIRALITLSSPHALAPVTFDGDILKIYQRTNDYWRGQMNDKSSFLAQNVSLISITGGILDMMLPADYTAVEDILPIENGFTTYSSTIPKVWTPVDHLAVVWCDQLRMKVARLLLEMVDRSTAEKVQTLTQRMFISRKMLLSGLEDEVRQDLEVANPKNHFKQYDLQYFHGVHDMASSALLSIHTFNMEQYPRFSRLLLPTDGQPVTFSLLTSLHNLPVYFCKKDVHQKSSVNCVSATHDLASVPASFKSLKYPAQSTAGDAARPFKMMSVDERVLSHYDFIIIENNQAAMQHEHDFVYAGLTSAELSTEIDVTPFQLALSGVQLNVNSTFLHHTFRFPKLWDSLLSYRVSCSSHVEMGTRLAFEPFLRQWIKDPFETKWHVNANDSEISINMHNVAPFIPLEELHDKSLMLTAVLPPNSTLVLKMRIHWPMTLRMLFIRYRLAFLSLPIAVAGATIAYQFMNYSRTGEFMTFNSALASVLKRKGAIALLIILLSPIANWKPAQRLLFMLDPIRLNRPFQLEKEHIHTNFYFLGIRSGFTSLLGLLFMLMSVAVLFAIAKIFECAEGVVIAVTAKCTSPATDIDVHTRNRVHRPTNIITSLLLLAAVFFYIPYHIASAISLMVQIGTCLRLTIKAAQSGSKDYNNLRRYNFSILLVLSFVVAINAPIIVVFLHNVAIKWETPFRSHHNVLAIAPIIFLVSANSTFSMPPSEAKKRYENGICAILFAYMGFFSLMYGARNLYWIHHLFNITCLWLLFTMVTNRLRTDKENAQKISRP